jgi:serine/threonine-protein kinase RsbW
LRRTWVFQQAPKKLPRRHLPPRHCVLAARHLLRETRRMHEGSITVRLPAELREVERLNRIIRSFGELHELPGRTLYAINLAIDELVTNIILYGYDDPANQEIVVRLETEGDALRATITDTGREFDPCSVPPPDLTLPLEERTLGGLGVHLVRSLMDRLEYSRHEGKNVLTIRKRIR